MSPRIVPPEPSAPAARSTYRHGDLRRALLDAGIELARDGGPDAAFSLAQEPAWSPWRDTALWLLAESHLLAGRPGEADGCGRSGGLVRAAGAERENHQEIDQDQDRGAHGALLGDVCFLSQQIRLLYRLGNTCVSLLRGPRVGRHFWG